MPRSLSTQFLRETLDPQSGQFVPVFLDISHASMTQTIRIVSDVVDYIYDDNRYTGFPFQLSLISDDERPPRAQISVQNADRRIGIWLLGLVTPPRLRLRVIADAAFGVKDKKQNARLPLGTPAVEYDADYLTLRNITIETLTISGDIGSYDFSSEPWPAIRSTRDRLPGLFR
jgi:hypothetical protein